MSYFDKLFDKGWQKLEENKFLRAGVCIVASVFLLLAKDTGKEVYIYLVAAGLFIFALYNLFPKFIGNMGAVFVGLSIIGGSILLGQLVDPMLPNIGLTPLAIIGGAIIIAWAIRAKK